MKWLLIYIALTGERVDVAKMGAYNTMNECFDAREKFVEVIGRPYCRTIRQYCVIEEDY